MALRNLGGPVIEWSVGNLYKVQLFVLYFITPQVFVQLSKHGSVIRRIRTMAIGQPSEEGPQLLSDISRLAKIRIECINNQRVSPVQLPIACGLLDRLAKLRLASPNSLHQSMYVCMYVLCMYVCMYVYMYVCTYESAGLSQCSPECHSARCANCACRSPRLQPPSRQSVNHAASHNSSLGGRWRRCGPACSRA